MLKQRVITALIITAIFLSALFILPSGYFAFFMAAVVLIGAWEWASLSNIVQPLLRVAYVLLVAIGLSGISFWIDFTGEATPQLDLQSVQQLLIVGCSFWAVALLWFRVIPQVPFCGGIKLCVC
jgi:phosphatidate cytidylyltransferase